MKQITEQEWEKIQQERRELLAERCAVDLPTTKPRLAELLRVFQRQEAGQLHMPEIYELVHLLIEERRQWRPKP